MRVTGKTPAVVGVPVMVPVAGVMARPAGSPVADQVKAKPACASVALSTRVRAAPETSDGAPGDVTETGLVMVQVKVAEPEKPALSVAVMVVENEPPVLGAPVMAPLAAMARPVGRPLADQDRTAVDEESAALASKVVMAMPETLDWGPGLVTDTVLVMVQVKLAEAEKPALSVADRLTG